MIKFIIQFLVYLFFFVSNARKKKGLQVPSNFIFGLYTLCALFGIPSIYLWGMEQSLSDDYWMPTFFFVICILIFISPFWMFNESSKDVIKLPSRKVLDNFSSIIIILSWFSIIYYSSNVYNILTLSDLGAARTQMGLGNESYTGSGLWNTVASVSASLNIFAILLFFIYYIIGNSPIRVMLLLGASLSEPIQVLTFIGRDGIVFWIFAFVFCYLLFSPYMQTKKKRKLKMISLMMFAALLIPFSLISSSRFEESAYGGTFGSIVCYLGQGFINGPLLFGIDNINYTGGLCFPLFFELTGIKPPASPGMVEIGDWKSWSFSTSIGSLYYNLGPWGLFCFLLVFLSFFIFAVQSKKTKTFYFHILVIYLLYFRLVAEGVFYFREYTRGGNLMIILFLFFSMIFSFKGYKSGITLKRDHYEK